MNKKINIIMFSGDYDKALAALILADTARDMKIDATMFFAFWGLFLLREPEKISLEEKSNYEKMFGMIMPKGAEDLPLSKMNFSGIGKKMLKQMMDEHEAPSLSDLLNEAQNNGVKFYGCKLSMEIMGITKEELIPELEVVTAQEYLQDALESDIQLFI